MRLSRTSIRFCLSGIRKSPERVRVTLLVDEHRSGVLHRSSANQAYKKGLRPTLTPFSASARAFIDLVVRLAQKVKTADGILRYTLSYIKELKCARALIILLYFNSLKTRPPMMVLPPPGSSASKNLILGFLRM